MKSLLTGRIIRTRRVTMTVGVAYETDLAHAYRVLSEAVAATPGVLAEPALQVSFEGFDESSIRMVFRFWIEWQTTNAADLQTQLTQVIVDVARREGINIPYPIRTVLLQNPIEPAVAKCNDSLMGSESLFGGPSWGRTSNQRFMRAVL